MTDTFARQCPGCHGRGGYGFDSYYDPPEPCGWCDMKGTITDRRRFYMVLGYLSDEARKRKQRVLA